MKQRIVYGSCVFGFKLPHPQGAPLRARNGRGEAQNGARRANYGPIQDTAGTHAGRASAAPKHGTRVPPVGILKVLLGIIIPSPDRLRFLLEEYCAICLLTWMQRRPVHYATPVVAFQLHWRPK